MSRILRAMRQAGYAVDVPESGAALIETIMERKAISEFRWTTVQEIEAKGGVLAHVDLATYRRWFDAYPENVRQKVAEAWGNPPGEPMNGVP
ncbi:MAG: cobaltochelatase subunit CobN, partial [Bilophila wadsworthia]